MLGNSRRKGKGSYKSRNIDGSLPKSAIPNHQTKISSMQNSSLSTDKGIFLSDSFSCQSRLSKSSERLPLSDSEAPAQITRNTEKKSVHYMKSDMIVSNIGYQIFLYITNIVYDIRGIKTIYSLLYRIVVQLSM